MRFVLALLVVALVIYEVDCWQLPSFSWFYPAALKPGVNLRVIELDTSLQTFQPGKFFTEQALGLIQELQTSSDKCLLEAFASMKVECSSLNADDRLRLGVMWLNCLRERSRLAQIQCSASQTVESCLSALDKDDFTQFQQLYLKVLDICAILSNDIFRAQVQGAVHRLQTAMVDANVFVEEAKNQWTRLLQVSRVLDLQQAEASEKVRNATEVAMAMLTSTQMRLLEELTSKTNAHYQDLSNVETRLNVVDNVLELHELHVAHILNQGSQQLLQAISTLKDSLNQEIIATSSRYHNLDAAYATILQKETEIRQTQERNHALVNNVQASLEKSQTHAAVVVAALGSVSSIALDMVRAIRAITVVFAMAILTETFCGFARISTWMFRVLFFMACGMEILGPLVPDLDLAITRMVVIITYFLTLSVSLLPSSTAKSTVHLKTIDSFANADHANIVTDLEDEDNDQAARCLPYSKSKSHNLPYHDDLTNELINYIVSLRLFGPSAPMSDTLAAKLGRPPSNYYNHLDEDGNLTLMSVDN